MTTIVLTIIGVRLLVRLHKEILIFTCLSLKIIDTHCLLLGTITKTNSLHNMYREGHHKNVPENEELLSYRKKNGQKKPASESHSYDFQMSYEIREYYFVGITKLAEK